MNAFRLATPWPYLFIFLIYNYSTVLNNTTFNDIFKIYKNCNVKTQKL